MEPDALHCRRPVLEQFQLRRDTVINCFIAGVMYSHSNHLKSGDGLGLTDCGRIPDCHPAIYEAAG